eukprot:TRINITY_DN88125_c0_g1_i1.p1 TRINITY_DN88125_c0_g1~~TRINITY_DN88125_c0_g1_i1.p1  ORF type:complete len:359 (-),score=-2.09 TRINITY_DN88125_c0_g1_i1:36-1112(-)
MQLKALLCLLVASLVNGQVSCNTELNVALYEYVPNLPQWQTAVERVWSSSHPDVKLNFVSWNCYEEGSPPPEVFVLDASYGSWFDYALPLQANEIANKEDLLPFALDGVKESDGTYLGIPQFLCTNALFYLDNDSQLATAKTLAQVVADLQGKQELSWDWGESNTTLPVVYAAVYQTLHGQFPSQPPLDASQLDTATIELMRETQKVLSAGNFFNGTARALFGYTESSSNQTTTNVGLRSFPSSFPSTFYFVDYACINKGIDAGKLALAKELVNVLTSAQVFEEAQRPVQQNTLPARTSSVNALKKLGTFYTQVVALLEQPNVAGLPMVYRLTPNQMKQSGGVVRTALAEPSLLLNCK